MPGFDLFFAGGEQPSWRKLLLENGVGSVAISFRNLIPRLPKTKPYDLAARYPGDTQVLIDSGAFGTKNLGREEAEEYMRQYRKFVEDNIDRIDLVTEFDHMAMGEDWIERWREDFWSTLPEGKFMPVWHAEQGTATLEDLAKNYDRIAVVGDVERSHGRLNGIVARHGTLLHGAAITKPDLLTSIRFASASSTSWISPTKYGDTIVWDGHRLRRYPKPMKDTARRRHRALFEKAGFDPVAIQNDNNLEVTKFTIWSWLQQEASVARKRGDRTLAVVPDTESDDVADISLEEDEVDFAEIDDERPTTTVLSTSKPNVLPVPRAPGEMRILPSMAFSKVRTLNGEGTGSQEVMVPTSTAKSMRRCDSCYVSGSCPAMTPGAECSFELPVEIKTKDQLMGTLTTLLEMQAQRIAFSRFAEELDGGQPDPNVSNEMDRFFKMTALLKEIQDNRDFFKVQIEAKGNAGVLSAIFGDKVGQQAKELPVPIQANDFDRRVEEIIDID